MRASGYTQPSGWKRTRERILETHPVCQLRTPDVCTRTATTVDHRTPVSQGGSHLDSNLQSSCQPCHDVKTETERRAALARRSRRREPRRHPGVVG